MLRSFLSAMAASSSLTISQSLVGRAISHHGSADRADPTAALPGFRLGNLAGRSIKSSSLRMARRLRPAVHRALPRAVRAAAVETLEKTETSMVEKSVNTIWFLAIDGVEKANSGHPGLPMGCAPMGHILYDEMMRYNPKNPYTGIDSCCRPGTDACCSMR